MPTSSSDTLPAMLPDRISVVGNTGSGKSTLAAQLAARLDCPFIELDALHWESNWTPAAKDVFQERVRAATTPDRWVIDGNYRSARNVYESRLQMMVWLDYPLVVNFWRLTRRNLQRILTREILWESGNRESFQSQFMSRDSLYVWAVKSHRTKRKRYQAFMEDPQYAHIDVVRLTSPRRTGRWLSTLREKD